MKKNVLTRGLALALSAFTIAPFAACAPKGNVGAGGEAIDESKTQLTVFHFFAGFGDEWMIELKNNFEQAMANVPFEEGKMGVQVHHRGEMRDFTASQIKTSQYDVLFMESPKDFLNIMADNAVEPLDSIMDVENASDNGQSIASKMTQQQKDFYNYNGHYYGIPHYAGAYGLIYNKDLFDAKGFYLAETPDEDTGNPLVSATNPKKGVGPDGQPGTEDDGLPRTYDEFFTLCEEIDARGVDPICLPGMYKEHHSSQFMDNLVSNNEGAEQMNLNYTFNGTATDLVVFNADGSIKRENGKIVTESKLITPDNAYELSRQKGRYYAFDFMHRLFRNTDYYNEEDATNTSMSHTENQQNFLENESLGKKPSAMLMDGTWWQIEADDVFSYMKENDEKYAKENRKFGWMPMPHPTEEDAQAAARGERKQVFNDYLCAVSCVKSGLSDGVKKAALEFMKYAYTDEALANFTYTTGATIGMDYFDAIDRSKLNYYETSLINYIENADRVYQVSGTTKYAANKTKFQGTNNIYSSGTAVHIINGIWDTDLSAEEYFKGHQISWKGLVW